MKDKPTPRLVLTSDVHFNIKNLREAEHSLREATKLADDLGVPLFIAGDLNDTKAILRAECVDAIISIFNDYPVVKKYFLIGNHDLVNEKSKEHSLGFLAPFGTLITEPLSFPRLDLYAIPYTADADKLKQHIESIPHGSLVLMHQGFLGAAMGEYVVDRTSIDVETVEHLRVITGHYHKHQTIGTVTYIGTPYTVSFHEANDGPKGVQILMSDGSLELHELKDLRRHIAIEVDHTELSDLQPMRSDTILRVKVNGPASELAKINKKTLGERLLGHANFDLEKIATKTEIDKKAIKKQSRVEMLDGIIKGSEETKEQKKYLRSLWKEVMDENS